jgi:hypothetical protein
MPNYTRIETFWVLRFVEGWVTTRPDSYGMFDTSNDVNNAVRFFLDDEAQAVIDQAAKVHGEDIRLSFTMFRMVRKVEIEIVLPG